LSRRRPRTCGFAKKLLGLGNRLDVNLVLLNIAPTIYWARILLNNRVFFRINNVRRNESDLQLQPNDVIHFDRKAIYHARVPFKGALKKYAQFHLPVLSSFHFPKNFAYSPEINTAIYKGLPREEDLSDKGRLHPIYFKLFEAQSGLGR
jgi:ribosomal protein S4